MTVVVETNVESYGAAMALLLHGRGVLLAPQHEWGIHKTLLIIEEDQ